MELLLVVGHNAADAAGVEIPGHLGQGKPRPGELEQRPLKEIPVVCLEMDLPVLRQYLPVPQQEVRMGQPPLGVAVARPGVAEVDVDAGDLPRGKVLGQQSRIPVHEKDVVQLFGTYPLHGDHHGVGHPLHRDIQGLGILLRGLRREAALAAAQLQVHRLRLGHQFPPIPPPRLRIGDQDPGAALHPGDQVGFSSHSHGYLFTS